LVKQSTAILVIVLVVILIAGGAFIRVLPKLIDLVSDFIGDFGGVGAENQAQVFWQVNFTDGTSETFDSPLSVFYQDKKVSYIGFGVQFKLTYTGNISSMSYKIDRDMYLNEVQLAFHNGDYYTTTDVGASGVWFRPKLSATLSVTAHTIETHSQAKTGDNEIKGLFDVSVSVTFDTGTTKVLTGSGEGSMTIKIEKVGATLQVRFQPIAISVYPTKLT